MSIETTTRYTVYTVTSSVNKVQNPHRVFDNEDRTTVDEFTSKKAAKMAADFYNEYGLGR